MNEETKNVPPLGGGTFKEDLIKDLKDPTYAAGYLKVAAVESKETFLLALTDILEAYKEELTK